MLLRVGGRELKISHAQRGPSAPRSSARVMGNPASLAVSAAMGRSVAMNESQRRAHTLPLRVAHYNVYYHNGASSYMIHPGFGALAAHELKPLS